MATETTLICQVNPRYGSCVDGDRFSREILVGKVVDVYR